MSVEDLYAMPDDGLRYELVHGSLVAEPPPGIRHGRVAATIVRILGSFVHEHKLGVVLTCDTGFVLHRGPDTVRAPDVSFITSDRFDALEDEVPAMPGPPDLAIEVVSPSNTPAAVHAKVGDYLAAGTPLVWVVDPASRVVHCYSDLLNPQIMTESDVIEAESLLPGFRLTIAEIFAV